MPNKVITIPKQSWLFAKRAAAIFVICLIIGSMISFFTPSVTLTLDPEERLTFWIVLCLIGGAGIFLCDVAVSYFFADWHIGLKSLLQTICGAIAVLIPVFTIYEPADLPSFNVTVLFVWTVMALIVAGTFIVNRVLEDPEIYEPANTLAQDIEAPKILARLPIHLRDGALYALSAEDHYVRVHTSKGEEMLLMRLSDSIAETGNVEGSQIHRSWWVAKDAIDDIKKTGRTAEIKMKNGQAAPVSRNGVKTLKAIGWL